MKRKVNKIIAIIMLAIVLINALPLQAFAKYITDLDSNAFFGVIANSYEYYKHEMHYCNYDGVDYILFCVETDKPSIVNGTYELNNEFWAEFKEHHLDYEKIAEMITFGYTMWYGTGLPTTLEAQRAAACTQQFVWEYLTTYIDPTQDKVARNSWNPNLMSNALYTDWLSRTEGYYNQYHRGNVSFAGSSNNVKAGESLTLTDTNNILSSYGDFSTTVGGVTFSHTNGSNDMNIATSEDTVGLVNFNSSDNNIYQLLPNGQTYNRSAMSNYLYFQFHSPVRQNMIYSNYVDPVTFNLSVNVEESKGKVKVKKTNAIGDSVAGCTFEIYSDSACTNKVATGTTNADGEILFEKLKPNTFYIKEVAVPKGYLIDNSVKSVEVKVGQTATVEFKNNEPTGEIYVYKVSENGDKVGGAKFKIVADEDIYNVAKTKRYYSKGQEVDTIVTENGTGIASKTGLPLGRYSVFESEVPQGYLLNETVYSVNLEYKDAITPKVEIKVEGVLDKEPRGTITIIKQDSETGNIPQGDAVFAGAVYEVYADEDIYNVAGTKKYYSKGDLVTTRVINENGTTEDVENIPLGNYIILEKTASEGYLLDTKKHKVELKYKDQVTPIISDTITSNEIVKKMEVHIFKSGIKVDSGKVPGLEGAEFTIKLNSSVERAYEQGYTYAEVWNGIDENGNQVEVDANRVKEAQEIAPSYAVITTDKDGNAYTEKNLPYGKFICKETFTPKDFETAVDFTFSITQDESEVKDVAQKSKHLVVNNEQLESYVRLVKKDLKSGEKVTLNSATFKIIASENIYDRGTGKILYKKGETITQKVGKTVYNTFTTNAKNMIIPDNSYTDKFDFFGSVTTPLKLPVGKYEISELSIPQGFLQLEKPVEFVIEGIRDYDKDKEGDSVVEIVIENEQPTGTLIIDKSITLREDADTSLIDTSDLSEIKFKLVAKENIIDMVDGSVIYEKGKEIGTYNLSKEGDLKITELPMGCYEFFECETLPGLVLDETRHEVKFRQKDTTTKVYTETKEIINDTTVVEISKQDISGEEIEGATLQVFDENNKMIDEWVSTKTPHIIEGLLVNKTYRLYEKICVEGYVKATDVEFTVSNTKDAQKVVMVDKIVEMSKKNFAGEELEGATIQVFDKDNKIVDEWVSSKEPHRISNLVENETYRLHEEICVEGYVKATDIEFTVTMDKETQVVEMIDKIVSMTKTDIGGKEIEGAEMSVTNEKGEIVDSWTSTKEPHSISNLEENKTYVLHELYAPDTFVVATDVEFTVTTDKETQEILLVDKVVEMSKQDINGNEIEGATMIVTNTKTKNIVDKWVSDKEPHKISGLIENENYILHEEICVDGFVKATDVEFTVNTDKETQKIIMIDKRVDVTKTDLTTGEEIEGAELVVTDEDGNIVDEWVSSKELHHISGLEENKTYVLTEKTAPYRI